MDTKMEYSERRRQASDNACRFYTADLIERPAMSDQIIKDDAKPQVQKTILSHRINRSAYYRKRANDLKAKGLCQRCKKPNDGPFINCESCRQIKEQQKRKYKKTARGKQYEADFARVRRKDPNYLRWRRDYLSERKKTDIQFRLSCLLRGRLYRAVKRGWKAGSAVRDLGCTISAFKTYIEIQFIHGMTWNNWGIGDGKWNIDHIVPLASVDLTDREQFLRVCHYTNLQPLWFVDNVRKGAKQESAGTNQCPLVDTF